MYNFATEAGMLQHAIQKAAAAASSLQYLVAKLYIGGPSDAMTSGSGSDGDGLSAVPLDTCEPHTHTSEGAPRRRFSEPGQHTTVTVCVCVCDSQVAHLLREGRDDRVAVHSPANTCRVVIVADLLLAFTYQAKGTCARNTSTRLKPKLPKIRAPCPQNTA